MEFSCLKLFDSNRVYLTPYIANRNHGDEEALVKYLHLFQENSSMEVVLKICIYDTDAFLNSYTYSFQTSKHRSGFHIV